MSAASVRGSAIWWTLTRERQAWCCLQVKLCDPCLSALRVCVRTKMALYKYSSFPFLSLSAPDSFFSRVFLENTGSITSLSCDQSGFTFMLPCAADRWRFHIKTVIHLSVVRQLKRRLFYLKCRCVVVLIIARVGPSCECNNKWSN